MTSQSEDLIVQTLLSAGEFLLIVFCLWTGRKLESNFYWFIALVVVVHLVVVRSPQLFDAIIQFNLSTL